MKTMVIEPVSAFNGMGVLVACDEGRFAAAALDLRIASHRPDELHSSTADDFNRSRIQVQTPEPIPEAEACWDWEWMSSWGVLRGGFDAATQVNVAVQRAAYTER